MAYNILFSAAPPIHLQPGRLGMDMDYELLPSW